MTRATIGRGTFAALLGLLAFGACNQASENIDSATAASSTPPPAVAHQDLIYGRVTTDDGDVYEGRLRFGGDEEALWDNYFNAVKDGNPWAADVPREGLKERVPVKVFGVEVGGWRREIDLGRPIMVRFGDIARIDAPGRDLRMTLKSGTVVDLQRYAADDFADGVRVWDTKRGVVDLDEWEVDAIEFLSTPPLSDAPDRLHGTVRTKDGDFTGFIQWNRRQALVTDVLAGHSADGELGLPFHTIRSIARGSEQSALVTMLDGSDIELSGSREVGLGNGGIYVDDPRYGRVLVSWDAFERIDFTPGGTGAAYRDFRPGRPLTGSVITRAGRQLSGRLVYDLDESETTETLDAPAQGVDYTIPFAMVSSIVLPDLGGLGARSATVTLHSGEKLQLDRWGDLSEGAAGLLVFLDGRERPEYVPWAEVAQVDFDRPAEVHPTSSPR